MLRCTTADRAIDTFARVACARATADAHQLARRLRLWRRETGRADFAQRIGTERCRSLNLQAVGGVSVTP
jgi:hypothetical protein